MDYAKNLQSVPNAETLILGRLRSTQVLISSHKHLARFMAFLTSWDHASTMHFTVPNSPAINTPTSIALKMCASGFPFYMLRKGLFSFLRFSVHTLYNYGFPFNTTV